MGVGSGFCATWPFAFCCAVNRGGGSAVEFVFCWCISVCRGVRLGLVIGEDILAFAWGPRLQSPKWMGYDEIFFSGVVSVYPTMHLNINKRHTGFCTTSSSSSSSSSSPSSSSSSGDSPSNSPYSPSSSPESPSPCSLFCRPEASWFCFAGCFRV